jgi:alpha-L-fucosidase
MKKLLLLFKLFLGITFFCQSQKLPVPTVQQLKWHDMEFYLFTHFGPNTFTDKEWGLGDEPENAFNPSQLDCRQWCRVAKAAGAKGIIITAKHHDGFCLWPTKYSTHTVKQSSWRNGKGDVLKELSHACKEYGLKFGVYLSPWDRNHPKYGTPEYNDVFVNMMKEIFSNYGPIWELWWDGANGEGPNGKKQVYDWKRFEKTVHDLSPNTIIFSDIGPHARWVGNEKGFAGKTNWNTLDTTGFTRGAGAPSQDTLNSGNVNGKAWIPAECDVSIRPGWFYHKEEDEKIKTPEELFDLYLKSVGRGANLLLNVPPDRRGLITANDSAALVGFKKLREESFSKNLVSHYRIESMKSMTKPMLIDKQKSIELIAFTTQKIHVALKDSFINCIVLREAIQNGQAIKNFTIVLYKNGTEIKKIEGTTIGRKRILTFDRQNVSGFTIEITQSKKIPVIKNIAAYLVDEKLIEK